MAEIEPKLKQKLWLDLTVVWSNVMRFGSFEKSEVGRNTHEKYILEVRRFLEQFYEQRLNSQSLYEDVMVRLESVLKHISTGIFPEEDRVNLKTRLAFACAKKNKKDFINSALEELMPLLQLREKYPKEFEEAEAKSSNEEQGYTELNRLVAYDKKGYSIMLHHSKAYTIGPKLRLYYDAMRKLAKIIEADPSVKMVEAVSWIVADAPDLFSENGFTVTQIKGGKNSIKDSFKKTTKEDKLASAIISREDFLSRFLDKK